jgi:hypothetical protein
MRVAGPAETMNPQALALYREFEIMLAHGRMTGQQGSDVVPPMPAKPKSRAGTAKRPARTPSA